MAEMKRRHLLATTTFFAALASLQTYATAHEHSTADTPITVVTHGAVIKLVHTASGHRLHSHDIPYGTGSGQQSVTAFHSSGDSNSYWLVKSPHSFPTLPIGTTVKCGDTIRLQHILTEKNLHSHLHRAPLNSDNEVSAYADGGHKFVDGDSGDNWILECTARGAKEWVRATDIRLKHVDTGHYLFSSKSLMYSDPIPQQLQVSASPKKNANTLWKTDEGFFVAPLIKAAQ